MNIGVDITKFTKYIYALRKLNLFGLPIPDNCKEMEVCPVCHIYTPGVKLNLFASNLLHWLCRDGSSPSLSYIYPPVKLNLFGGRIVPAVQCFRPVNISLVLFNNDTPAHQVLVQFDADIASALETDFRIPLPQRLDEKSIPNNRPLPNAISNACACWASVMASVVGLRSCVKA